MHSGGMYIRYVSPCPPPGSEINLDITQVNDIMRRVQYDLVTCYVL